MKKQILILLLIASTDFTHAMEKEPSFSSFFSWLFSQTPNESKLITNLRKSKNNFEKQLLTDEEQVKKALRTRPIGSFMKFNSYPVWFLQYCYYQETIQHLDEHLNFIATIPSYKNMQVNGYTALGATIISKEPSTDKKRSFIQKLLNYGSELMPKDIELAELILYDAIAKHQNTIMDLLHTQPHANWFVLPQEIRTQITQYLIQLFKNEFWLLPEKSLNDV